LSAAATTLQPDAERPRDRPPAPQKRSTAGRPRLATAASAEFESSTTTGGFKGILLYYIW